MVDNQKIGSYAFLLGVIIAILAGAGVAALAPAVAGYIPLVLVILGLIVGFLNIGDKEIQSFLVAGIALIAVGIPSSALLTIPLIGVYVVSILQGISTFAAPAVLVVALKAFYNLSKTPTV